MAKALDFTPREPTPQERLHSTVEDSAPALEESLRLLRDLHNHGVLDVLSKTVRGGEGLVASLLHITGGQSGTTLLRNTTELAKVLSTLDPHEVSVLGKAISVGVHEGARSVAQGKRFGVGDLMGLLRDRDVQIALGALVGILKGVGRGLRESRHDSAAHPVTNQTMVGRGTR
ncbi:DUF1641 domain-containing protein [Deinococcus aerophilus]|uniref:DUF1641 domain-containing protein n=1 Tax=Deinococcus aerophilus TaxID=522488 RepID=A0ABQ2GQZ8_9DEIO|nr:DUF1641 domain-containing protein [Deinococcus aerophilus]GGM08786.1 hypothetical protein GCM10010841_16430 [Deinococcus aerophilus]